MEQSQIKKMSLKVSHFLLLALGITICACTQSMSLDKNKSSISSKLINNDSGITFDGTNLTIKTNINSDLSVGSFGGSIRINNGVELFFYGAGAVAGQQEFVISKSDLELELGQSLSNSNISVRIGYSNKFPASTVTYTGAFAEIKN